MIEDPKSVRDYVMNFGGVFEAYDAALDGRIHPLHVAELFNVELLIRYRMVKALERIAAHLANPVITMDPARQGPRTVEELLRQPPRKPQTVRSLVPTRCDECNGVPDRHTPNCPIGKKDPKALTHAEATRPEEYRG